MSRTKAPPPTARMERVMSTLGCTRSHAAKVVNLMDEEPNPAAELLADLIAQERAGRFGQSIETQAKEAGVSCD